jgi:hypothetical protein
MNQLKDDVRERVHDLERIMLAVFVRLARLEGVGDDRQMDDHEFSRSRPNQDHEEN